MAKCFVLNNLKFESSICRREWWFVANVSLPGAPHHLAKLEQTYVCVMPFISVCKLGIFISNDKQAFVETKFYHFYSLLLIVFLHQHCFVQVDMIFLIIHDIPGFWKGTMMIYVKLSSLKKLCHKSWLSCETIVAGNFVGIVFKK